LSEEEKIRDLVGELGDEDDGEYLAPHLKI
jgi:hypothetical protein